MSIDIEKPEDLAEQLAAGMRAHVAGITGGGDVLARATRRHRRRTAVIRTGYALGVAGLAGALAVGLTTGAGGGEQDGRQSPVVQAEPPASLKLSKAAAASDNISYRMKLTMRSADGKTVGESEGAFDPMTATGYIRRPQDDSVMVELLIDGVRYMGAEPPLAPLPPDKTPGGEVYGRYGQYPGRFDRLSLAGNGMGALGSAGPDPATLFKALQGVNAAVTQYPDGTLHFEYSTHGAPGDPTLETRVSGDVTLNADGRIAKVTMQDWWQSTIKRTVMSGQSFTTLELSDYGVPVHVDRPTDVVPAN
ncbi:hypothetical protein [Dactylosporangium sp. NPDC000521]|uniref:hypothetical protein n=1 Tax=Dactylosporangium sp. NPDC000521 TaxID=3363975 RepID=UPI0036770CE1